MFGNVRKKRLPLDVWRRSFKTFFVFFVCVFSFLSFFTKPAQAALTDNLESYWKLDEASGTRTDSVGANHLTDNNTVTQADGKLGNAGQFTSANAEFLTRADNSSLSVGDTDFTISAWVYLDSKSGIQMFVGKYAGNGEYALYYDGGSDRFMCSTFPQLDALVTPVGGVQTGQWYFLTCSHNATTHVNTITVNNTWTGMSGVGSEPDDTSSEFAIGRFLPSGSTFYANGRIDAVGFWKRTLTSDEITTLYNSGAGLEYPFSTFSAGSISLVERTIGTIELVSAEATGGTAPYTYQWYRSSGSGFTPGGGNILSGQTSLQFTDTSLSAASTYYYKLRVTDSTSATADSAEFSATTLAPPATSFTFTGPSSGTINTNSTNFTVTPNGTYTGSFTLSTTGSGTFTPSSLSWSNASDAKTFSYTPTTTAGSPHTVSVSAAPVLTNSSGSIPFTVNEQTTYYQILSTGQSLSTVYYAQPALSTTQPYSNLMLSPGVEGVSAPLIPLIESGQGEGGDVETISSGMANSLHIYENLFRPIVVGLHGHNATTYGGLKKGTAWFSKGMTQASVTKTYVENTLGGIYRPLAVTAIHGESDYLDGLAANYEGYLAEWQADYESDLNALTGRSDTIPLFINQMSSARTGEIADAQLNAHKNNEGKIILVEPKYQYHYHSDKLHMDVNTQEKHMGEMFAKVMNKVLFENETWNPLMPSLILRSGNEIIVSYHIPFGTLAIDTTNVAERPAYGFEFSQTGGNSVSIDSVELIENNTQVKITLSDIPTGTNQGLKYAWSCYTSGTWCAQAGDSTAVGGNIRDTDSSISPSSEGSGLPLYDWGVSFNEDISEDSTAPTFSSITTTATSDGAIVNWTTNEASSSQVNYGLTSSYGSSTNETNTALRVSSHSQTITGLLPCTTYHYQTQGTDSATNTGTGDDNSFTTIGCTGSASIDSQSSSTITTASGGSLSLLSGSTGITLSVPSAFSGSDAHFQIKQLDSTSVINTTSTPMGYALIDSSAYDLKALSGVATSVTSFNTALTVSMLYEVSDVAEIDESSLRIYRWDGSSWNQLTGCSANTTDKSVTCTTTAFSVFGLFGQAKSSGPSNSSTSKSSSSGSTSTAGGVCNSPAPGAKAPWLYGAIPQSGNSILLYFTEADEPIDSYALEFGTKPGEYSFGTTNLGGKGSRTYLVQSLQPNTTYYFRVRGGNGCATGNWSNEISATTKSMLSFQQLDFTKSELEPVVPMSEEQAKSPPSVCRNHTVQFGDNLWDIAASKLGDGIRYKEIIEQNTATYPSLASSNNLRVGWELELNCDASDSSTAINDSEKSRVETRHIVNITVVDTEQRPVAGAKVTLHSTVQETTTDKNGLARFTDVEPGDHKVLIAYKGFEGEQSLNLTGDVTEFNLNVTVERKNILLAPQLLIGAGVFLCIIGVLVALLFKAKKKN